jgi:cytochrome c oxidase assembly protein subunit 15
MEGRVHWVRRLALVSVILTVLLMTLGAWVKANGAGLACPDWPKCYGKWLPPFPSAEHGDTWQGKAIGYTQAQELYEWTHRAVVSLTLVPLLVLAIVAARDRSFATPLRTLPALALGLYLFQALLGAITVWTGNPPWATTWHLLNATLLLVTLVVACCYAYLKPPRLVKRKTEFRFTPSVHTSSQGFTYPGTEAPAPEPPAQEPSGRFPGELEDADG